MIEVIKEALLGSINSVLSITLIIIPIMIVLQIMKDYKFLDRITRFFRFFPRLFKTTGQSVMPLLVGIIFGLAFGAGVIIQSAKEGNLTSRDKYLITIFLISCHAVFEDTLVFVAVGANGFILLGLRLMVAFLFTFLTSKRDQHTKSQTEAIDHTRI